MRKALVGVLISTPFLFTALLISQGGLAQAQTPPVIDPVQHAADILKEGMADSNPEKRKQVAVAMSLAAADTAATPLLREALKDKDVEVRIAACASLAEMKDRTSIPDLKQALDDDTPEVRFAAARALALMGNQDGEDLILAVLVKEEKTSSNIVVRKKREAMRMLQDKPGLFKLAVKQGVGMVPIPGIGFGMSSFEDLMNNSGASGPSLAALILAQEKDAESLEALRDALSDDDWGVRAAAVHSLAVRNASMYQGDMVPLLDDKKAEVRYRAAAAYLRLAKPRPGSRPRRAVGRKAAA
ncbi:MAG: HEAT repeat domain-containing protein [Blastocatellia bacterium]